jgi:F5/8 type C domain-containing protein
MSYPVYYKQGDSYTPVTGYVYNTSNGTVIKSEAPQPQPPQPSGDIKQLSVPPAQVTASANDGNLPANVVDRNNQTRWSAQGAGQWINLDLMDQAGGIGKVEIEYYNNNSRVSKGDLLVDGNKVSPIQSDMNRPVTTITLDPNTVKGRNVRIVGQGNSVNDWNSITEIRVFGTGTGGGGGGVTPEPPTPQPEPPQPTGDKDKYGIKMLFPTVSGGRTFYPPDNMPTQTVNATKRLGTTEMVAHGQGSVTPGKDYYKLVGSAPRMYMYKDDNGKDLWENIEITCYYNRVSQSSTSYAGFVMGGRSYHHLGGTKALAYYLKHHYSSKKFYLMKEQEHGGAGNRGYTDNSSSAPTSALDGNTWYGAKLVIRTSRDGKSVKLEAYKDDTNGKDGGTWKKLTEKVDDGNWNSYAPFFKGPACMFRTDGVTDFRYKWFSVRTIAGLS